MRRIAAAAAALAIVALVATAAFVATRDSDGDDVDWTPIDPEEDGGQFDAVLVGSPEPCPSLTMALEPRGILLSKRTSVAGVAIDVPEGYQFQPTLLNPPTHTARPVARPAIVVAVLDSVAHYEIQGSLFEQIKRLSVTPEPTRRAARSLEDILRDQVSARLSPCDAAGNVTTRNGKAVAIVRATLPGQIEQDAFVVLDDQRIVRVSYAGYTRDQSADIQFATFNAIVDSVTRLN